jgi:hypothetical protein
MFVLTQGLLRDILEDKYLFFSEEVENLQVRTMTSPGYLLS